MQRPLIKNLLEAIEKRLTDLNLKAELSSEKQYLTELTVFCTAMAMNYLSRGKFVQS